VTSSFLIRPSEPGDQAALDGLFRSRFGHGVSRETLAWKYELAPGRSRSLVAEAAGRGVVAHAGALGLPARAADRTAFLWQVSDVVAARETSGLRPAIVDLLDALFASIPGEEDWPWLFGFPGDRHHRLGERLYGYRPLAPVAELGGNLDRVAAGPPIGGTDRAEPWAEEAWRACDVDSVARTVEFLAWRYWSRPDRYYRFYRLEGGAAAPGLVVFAFQGEEARATELWLPGGDPLAYELSLRRVAADLLDSGIDRWTFWGYPAAAPRALADAFGLRPEERVWTMSVRPCRGLPLPAAATKMRYCLGDYDVG